MIANDSKVISERRGSIQFKTNADKSSSGATGKRAIAAGVYANAFATDSIAIGTRANINNYWGWQGHDAINSIAIGRQAQVENGRNSIALGANAEILHYQAFALSPDNSIAIGNGSKIIGANSAIAIGNKADVTAIDGGRGSAANNAIAIGNQATVRRSNSISLGKGVDTAGENSVSIGVNIQSAKNNSITIGQNAKTSQERTIAIGAYADANSDRTVAIGAEAKAYGSKSIVIGGLGERGSDKQAQSKVGARSSIVIGNGSIADTSAQHSIVLGSDAKVSSSQGISIGKNAKVLANSLGAISIGTNATTSHAQDIAIGQNSETSTPNNLSTLTIGDQSLQKGVISTVNTGVVSVGNSTTKRQIQNVAAGNVSENSTDAINGSQLYYVVKAADEIAKTEYVFTVNGNTAKTMNNKNASDQNTTNNKLDFKAGEGLAVAYEDEAVTYKLNDESKQAIEDAKGAAGTVNAKLAEINEATSRAEQSKTAAAQSAQDAERSKTAAAQSAQDAKASENATKAIQTHIENSGLISKDGKTSLSGNNSSGSESAMASGKNSSAIGYGAEAAGEDSTAIGNSAQAQANGSTALGNTAKAESEGATAVGHNAKAEADNSVALGKGSVAKEKGTVSVGTVGNERRITNVQDPKYLTDAANKRYVDRSINSVRHELRQTDKKLRGGIAGAVAIANIPTNSIPGGTMIGLAFGNFKGQNALAIGISKSSDNNRIHLKLSGSATSAGDYAVGAGIGYQW
ncbi:adhesin [Haemophilus aegyptius]|nr:adhesin [Haemophilus aegyptius]